MDIVADGNYEMTKIHIFIALVFFTLLASCQPGSEISAQNNPLESEISTEVVTESPTSTAHPTLTATVPTQQVNILAPEWLNKVPENEQLNGVIVVGDYMSELTRLQHAYLMDAQTGEKISDLPPNIFGGYRNFELTAFDISPDRKKLSYYSSLEKEERLYIVDGNGQVILDQEIVKNDGSFLFDTLTPGAASWEGVGWLDNEQLVVVKVPPEDVIKNSLKPYSIFVYNPFSSGVKEYPPDFPEISFPYLNLPRLGWSGQVEMKIDPSQTRMVYGTIDASVVLWDLELGKEIIRFPPGSIDIGPVWKPDGSEFMIELPGSKKEKYFTYELYRVTRDGQISQLTNLGNEFSNVVINLISWSPDEKSIAFVVVLEPDPFGEGAYTRHVAVLSLDDLNEVNVYCGVDAGFTGPIWSPDGKQILFGDSLSIELLGNSYLLDLEEGYLAVLERNLIPLAWMSKP